MPWFLCSVEGRTVRVTSRHTDGLVVITGEGGLEL
jgi:hypothetical protein